MGLVPAVTVAALLVTAAPQTKPGNIVIAVANDQTVTITLDGKKITCEQLNRHFAELSNKANPPLIDCKALKTKHDQ